MSVENCRAEARPTAYLQPNHVFTRVGRPSGRLNCMDDGGGWARKLKQNEGDLKNI
jgi:hypothetical protein